jgi:hypothetical protein
MQIYVVRSMHIFSVSLCHCVSGLKISFALNAFDFAFSADASLTLAMQLAQYAKYARGGYTGAIRCTCAISAA